jgi:hypothetical protein
MRLAFGLLTIMLLTTDVKASSSSDDEMGVDRSSMSIFKIDVLSNSSEWTGTFVLDNGLEVSHNSHVLTVKKDGHVTSMVHCWFNQGMTMFNVNAEEKGQLGVLMLPYDFATELRKLGAIVAYS